MKYFQCVSAAQAEEIILKALDGKVLAAEQVLLTNAVGNILAEDILAQEDLPLFDRSTVDGFAVRSTDTFGATEASPALLSIVGEVFMGETASRSIMPGQAMMIPTGGMVPSGADTVIMLEHTEQPDINSLLICKTAAPQENIIHKGEDIRAGSIVLTKGLKLAPAHIGILAACGVTRVPVRKSVAVAIISTGDELVNIEQQPHVGQLRDINSYTAGAMLKEFGCSIKNFGIVKDDYTALLDILQRAAAWGDLVIVSGGSSVGARDYTVQAINSLGKPGVLFHGIAVKPGKPTIFGMLGNIPVFGLPGHPAAALLICEQLIKPAVETLRGQKKREALHCVFARIARNVASLPGRDDYITVRLAEQEDGYIAFPIFGKSGLITTMAQADGILHIPAGKSGLYAGEWAKVRLISNNG